MSWHAQRQLHACHARCTANACAPLPFFTFLNASQWRYPAYEWRLQFNATCASDSTLAPLTVQGSVFTYPPNVSTGQRARSWDDSRRLGCQGLLTAALMHHTHSPRQVTINYPTGVGRLDLTSSQNAW